MTATLPGPQVDLEVCLAVGQQALAGVWDTGTWDTNVWAQTDTELGDWVDVTCNVEVPFEMHAGTDRADGVVTRWEAATTALTLHGDAFNPRSGPYAGLLGPGLPVRIRWRPTGAPDWRPGFSGYVDDDGFTWTKPAGHVGSAHVAATDGTRILNAADLMKRAPVGAGETASARVTRIADAVQWPTDQRGIQPGGVTVRSTTLDGSAWSQLLLVADTDLAHLWIDGAGVLRYVPQGRVLPARQPTASITCVAGNPGIPAFPPVSITGQQPTVIRNVANIQRSVEDRAAAAPVATVSDDQSGRAVPAPPVLPHRPDPHRRRLFHDPRAGRPDQGRVAVVRPGGGGADVPRRPRRRVPAPRPGARHHDRRRGPRRDRMGL